MSAEMNRLLLGTQRALLDAITPELRAVTVNIKDGRQIFSFFYDCEVTEELLDLARVAATEASCSLDYFSDDRVMKLEFPKKIPIEGRLVFLRNEPKAREYIHTKYEFHSDPPVARLLLYLQQALLGRLPQNLRTVSVDIEEISKALEFYFIFDSAITIQDQELSNSAITETANSFRGHQINRHIQRINYAKPIPLFGQRMAYARRK